MEKNIVLFGDSIAKGLKIQNGRPVKLNKNAVEIIEKSLNITINNQSCFGQTVSRLCRKKLIDEYVNNINKDQENIVVFNLGGNDADFDWKKVAENPQAMHEANTSLDNFRNCYINIIKTLQENNVKVYLCTLPPVNSHYFYENYIKNLVGNDKVLEYFAGDLSLISRHQELYSQAIMEIAFEYNVPLIDLRKEFLKQKNLVHLYSEDGIHPNEEAQELIAKTIIEFFKKVL